jgi:hypothetical protein
MKTTLTMLAFMVACGCSGMTYDDLEYKSMTCEPRDSEECKKLVRRFERVYEKEQNKVKCPSGTILLEDRGRSQCIPREAFGVFIGPFGD